MEEKQELLVITALILGDTYHSDYHGGFVFRVFATVDEVEKNFGTLIKFVSEDDIDPDNDLWYLELVLVLPAGFLPLIIPSNMDVISGRFTWGGWEKT